MCLSPERLCLLLFIFIFFCIYLSFNLQFISLSDGISPNYFSRLSQGICYCRRPNLLAALITERSRCDLQVKPSRAASDALLRFALRKAETCCCKEHARSVWPGCSCPYSASVSFLRTAQTVSAKHTGIERGLRPWGHSIKFRVIQEEMLCAVSEKLSEKGRYRALSTQWAQIGAGWPTGVAHSWHRRDAGECPGSHYWPALTMN